MDTRQAYRLEVLEAVANVIRDPARLFQVIGGAEDEDQAVERIMSEYGVAREVALHMLDAQFRRLMASERTKVEDEIRSLRERLSEG